MKITNICAAKGLDYIRVFIHMQAEMSNNNYIIPQIAIFLNKKSRYRETPAAHGLPAFLCTCFLMKWLGDFESADKADADFFFGEYGDFLYNPVH